MFIHVTSVRHIRDYLLEVRFTDGVEKEIDLSNELHGKVFEELKDIDMFGAVYLDEETRTIAWPNGADLAPEYLYEIGQDIRQVV